MAGTWTAGIVESMAGAELPTVEEWEPVAVPGRPARFVGTSGPVAYRTYFGDPRADAGDRTFVELRGAYGLTRAWVNDRYLGEHDCPFVPARFEFDAARANKLLVVCTTESSSWVPTRASELHPSTTVPGVHWDATVTRRPTTFLRSLEAETQVTDDGAVIDVSVTVDAGAAVDDAVTFSLRPEGFPGGGSMERARVEADAGHVISVEQRIRVRDPSLWWPRELGPQHRYTLRAKLADHSIERTIGLRRLEREEDRLLVNGKRLRARGFTRFPISVDYVGANDDADTGSAVDTVEAAVREDVRRVIEANGSIIRARAHVPPHTFYDACDEAGLLVWQDLPTGDDVDVGRTRYRLDTLYAAYGHHPSLVTYGVQTARPDLFESPIGSGLSSTQTFRWRAWRAGFDRSDAEEVAEALPPDVDVVPVVGPPGTNADAAAIYPGWQYFGPSGVEWLLDRYPSLTSVVAEFGAGTLATDGSQSDPTLNEIATTLRQRGISKTESPIYQETVLKTVAEALRRRGVNVLIAETLRDSSPGGGMGVLDASGNEKPGYDALTQSYEPVQAIVDGLAEPGSLEVVIVNDTPDSVTPTVTWTAGEAGGELEASVAGFGRATAGTIDVPRSAVRLAFRMTVGDRTVRNRYRL